MYRDAKGVEFGVFFLPARSHVCEKVFAEEGVFGDVHIGDYPLSFIPFDSDVLSSRASVQLQGACHMAAEKNCHPITNFS